MRQTIRAILDQIDRRLAPLAAAHRLLANGYYALINPRFRRELTATIAGRAAYQSAVSSAPISLLRRNIHRLEKGLTMQPRSPVFAEGYIQETVSAYTRLRENAASDPETLRWAHDVLDEYFSVVGSTVEIARARDHFIACDHPIDTALAPQDRWSPKPREAGVASSVTFDQFLLLCKQRRSTRWFLPKRVPAELLDQAIEAALQAPSACNRQPFFFRSLLQPEEAAEVASIAMGTAGYSHQIPALVVVIGDLSAFEHERDRHVPYIDSSLATMQLMLALETLGLASCPINWPDIEPLEQRMAKRLALKPFERPIMLLALGYPDPEGGIAHSAKKTPAQIQRHTAGTANR